MDKIQEKIDASFLPKIEELTRKLNGTKGIIFVRRERYLSKIEEITERIQKCCNKK